MARRIEAENPGWTVHYGQYSHDFYAFPMFAAPSGTTLRESDPAALIRGMREIERLVRVRRALRNL